MIRLAVLCLALAGLVGSYFAIVRALDEAAYLRWRRGGTWQ